MIGLALHPQRTWCSFSGQWFSLCALPRPVKLYTTWYRWCTAKSDSTIRPMEIRHLIYFASIINSVIYQQGPSWPWSYGSWIYNYLCNQCLSALMLWVQISIRARCTTKCDKVCQWLATDRCFSPGTTISSTNKTDRHDIAEILLKVAFNSI